MEVIIFDQHHLRILTPLICWTPPLLIQWCPLGGSPNNDARYIPAIPAVLCFVPSLCYTHAAVMQSHLPL